MQLTAILITVCCLTVSARTVSQTITFTGENVELKKIFQVVRQQTGFYVFYDKKLVAKADGINISVKDMPLEEFLKIVLVNENLTYSILNTTITIEKKATSGKTPSPIIETPPITVRGKVVNEKGEPVVVTIKVKGSNNGTTSNSDGRFELIGIDSDAILIISAANIESTSIGVDGKSDLSISVKTFISSLDEIIFKGYYSTTTRLNTGNVSKVTSKEIEKQPVANPLAALQGRVPGLEISQQTGVPGGNFQIRIRGRNSISNGNDPLYIIDGVPYSSTSMAFLETSAQILPNGTSPFNSINPSDITSIEILKDGDATAIYGSRGANGVILITTKKGEAGKSKVDINYYHGFGKAASKMDNLLTTSEYVQTRREAFENSGLWPVDPAFHQYIPDFFVWDTTRYTDWQKELIGGTAQTDDAQLSFSGGNKNLQYNIGGGYRSEGTVFPGSNKNNRMSAHSALTTISENQKLRTSFSLNYSINKVNFIAQDLTPDALTLAPNAPALFTKAGDLNWGDSAWNENYLNPLRYLKTSYDATTKSLLANFTASYLILKNLEVKTSMGLSDVSMSAINMVPKTSMAPTARPYNENASNFSNSSVENWTIEPQVIWKPSVGVGRLDIVAGTTFLQQISQGLAQYTQGYANEALMKNISAASMRFPGTDYYRQYRYNALFGRVAYSLLNKYIVNFTGRRDGSSRFGAGKQFANFGAVGAAWIFSNENWLNNLRFLSFGKIRGSYGITGNDQLPDYEYLDTYRISGSYPNGGPVGLTPARLPNNNFAWEENKKLEIALELGFFQDRIFTNISYYKNRSSNQLVGFPLPPTTGFTSIRANFPALVQNTGIEVELVSQNIKFSRIKWSTSFNLSFPRNKLIEFPNLAATPTYANSLVVGQPLSILKRYKYTGIDPETGLYTFKDVNDDGRINVQDRQEVISTAPEFYGGIINTVEYKGFQLDFNFQFVRQTKATYINSFVAPGNVSNQPNDILNRWRKPGDNSEFQKISLLDDALAAYQNFALSNAGYGDASFIRLKNVSLTYSFNNSLLKKLRIPELRVFMQGQNLLTITDYRGLDPETGTSVLPPLKVLAFGFHITF